MKKVLVLLVSSSSSAAAPWPAWRGRGCRRRSRATPAPSSSCRSPLVPARLEIRERLLAAGVVQDALTLRLALRWTGASRDLQAGEYRFDQPMTALEVVDKIVRGDVYGQRITFPEGLTIREMAALFESRGLGKAREFIDASRKVALIQDLDQRRPTSRVICSPTPIPLAARPWRRS